MSLLKKVEWFYKLAQEIGSDMPMKLRETGVGGIAGKNMPSKGYPYQSIRELASRLLRRLQSHPSVPRTVKAGTSSFGDLLSDFNNSRFTDKDLNYYWGDYIVALMNKANGLVQTAANENLSEFYKSFVEDLGDLFDNILEAGWSTKVRKPMVADFVGAAENPFAADKVYAPVSKPKLSPSTTVKDTVNNISTNPSGLKGQEGSDLAEEAKKIKVEEPKFPKIMPGLSTSTMAKYRIKK